MDTFTDVLFVTANVGSLFDMVDEIQNGWLEELFKTIRKHKAQFIALHFQEVGGKDYHINMDRAGNFFSNIESSEEMKEYNRSCIYVDTHYRPDDRFTALGSMYFIHKKLKNVHQYDFNAKEFKAVVGHTKHIGSLDGVAGIEKEKYPKSFWPDFMWSRKGFMRTRWLIQNQGFDLVNIHLFHDASNVIAVKSTPSVYSLNRRNALKYVINRLIDSSCPPMPFFLFGDFNFRLDTYSLVEYLTTEAHVSDSVDHERITYSDDNQMLLQIEKKLFEHVHQAIFRENNGRGLLQFDRETIPFDDYVREEDITFPPTYPYSEESYEPRVLLNTRCPAWCDRILMSHTANKFINRSDDDGQRVVYNIIGPNVCMGDHKPVFLAFQLKTNQH